MASDNHAKSRNGLLWTDGWSGRRCQAVEVIAETPKRFRIQAFLPTKLAGRSRWIGPGETALVPKGCVTFPAAVNEVNGE